MVGLSSSHSWERYCRHRSRSLPRVNLPKFSKRDLHDDFSEDESGHEDEYDEDDVDTTGILRGQSS